MTEESWSVKTTPGISSYASHPTEAGTSIQPLLNFAIETVLHAEGVTDLSGVPVFLGATAGMRMLPPATITSILSSIQTTVQAAGFMYNPEWIRVLSGEEEGTFGWVAANSLLGTLTNSSTETVGALDLGGASTQVTFHPDESILAGFFDLNIASSQHRLYTHSYLYYGADQARLRLFADLIAAAAAAAGSANGAAVVNPCFPTGYTAAADSTHPTVLFTGSSDWEACLAAATKLITDYQPLTPSSPAGVQCLHSDHQRCTFNGVYQPQVPPNMKLLAMSSFYFDWKYFGLTTGMDQPSSDLNALAVAAKKVCSMNSEGQAAYNNSLAHPGTLLVCCCPLLSRFFVFLFFCVGPSLFFLTFCFLFCSQSSFLLQLLFRCGLFTCFAAHRVWFTN